MIQEIVFSSDKNVLVREGERKDDWVATVEKSLNLIFSFFWEKIIFGNPFWANRTLMVSFHQKETKVYLPSETKPS